MSLTRTRPWIIAHRGVPKEAPENTLKGIELAITQGADFVEVDVHLSADGHLVVIHDDRVDRTTNGTGLVNNLSLHQLQLLDAGSWMGTIHSGERIPSFNEVVELTSGRIGLVVELKHGSTRYRGVEELLAKQISSANRVEDIIIISGDSAAIHRLNSIDKQIMTLDFGHIPLTSPRWLDCPSADIPQRQFVFVDLENADRNRIRHVQRLGFRILSTLVNTDISAANIEMLFKSGVDGVFTDHALSLKKAMLKRRNDSEHG